MDKNFLTYVGHDDTILTRDKYLDPKETNGLIVYNTFKYKDSPNFTAAIKLQISELQYWRDIEQYKKTEDAVLKPAFDFQKDPIKYYEDNFIDEYGTIDVLNELQKFQQYLNDYYSNTDNIIQDINMYSNMDQQDESKNVVCDTDESDTTANLNTIVSSFYTIDLNKYNESVELLDKKESLIKTELFVDEKTQDKYCIIDTYIQDAIKKMASATENLGENFLEVKKAVQETTEDIVKDQKPEDQTSFDNSFKKSFLKSTQIWFGIPLIDMNDYVLQIHNRRINLFPTSLTIDEPIEPNEPFIAGVTINNGSVTIFLKKDNDPKFYSASGLYDTKQYRISLMGYGTAKVDETVKNIDGIIWDIYFWPKTTTFNFNPEYYYPDTCFFYDFKKIRNYKKTMYAICNYVKPLHFEGRLLELNNQNYVLYNAYLNKFACRHKFKNDFSIMSTLFIQNFQNRKAYFISDIIHSNFIWYDFDEMKLHIFFNGKHIIKNWTLPEHTVFSFFLSYKRNSGELLFGVFTYEDPEEYIDYISVNIGQDLEFELLSMFGIYDRQEKQFKYILKNTLIFHVTIWERKFKKVNYFRNLISKNKAYFNMFSKDYLINLKY